MSVPAYRRTVLATTIRMAGAILFLLALAGTWYAVRVSRAQFDYHQLKHVQPPGPDYVERTRALHKRYPRNYHLLAWATERAFDQAQTLEGDARLRALAETRQLCDWGLALNPYHLPFPIIHTALLSQDSLDAAIAYWETFVAWDYWNPYNHAYLVELYAADGRFGAASRSLRLIEHTSFSKDAIRALQHAYERESRMPPGLFAP